jgi:ComF family protein
MSIALPLAALTDLLLPPRCALCHGRVADASTVCAACAASMPWFQPPWCPRCGVPPAGATPMDHPCRACDASPPAFHAARAPLRFEGPARDAVHAMKYGRRHRLSRWLADRMVAACSDLPMEAIDVVVPVPSHWMKARLRGGNPAAWLAQAVARRLGRRLDLRALRRRHWTRSQTRLSPEQRRRNVAEAFTARPTRARTALLIDDVVTSGATGHACAQALREAGIHEVYVLAAARTPRYQVAA